MKITAVNIHTPDQNAHVLVEIVAEDGSRGWGACYSEQRQIVGALGWITRFVVGQDVREIERITETLFATTFWLGRGGAMNHAISGLNIALWDCAGKVLKTPVHALLGGAHRKAVKAYGSVLFHPVDTLAARIAEMRARNFRAIKLGWEPFGRAGIREDRALMELARKAAGDEVEIMIDAGGSGPFYAGTLKKALEQARMLADYNVRWFEEALRPDDVEGYRRLTDASPVPISGGEVFSGRRAFKQTIDERLLDIIQPDVAKVGGLSEMRRLAWAAWDAGLELIPHGWNTAVGVAADLALMATAPTPGYIEFNVGNPMVEAITRSEFVLDGDGMLAVPDGPGFGIDIDEEKVRGMAAAGYRSPTWTWDDGLIFEARRD
jgi:L-alanine-DL-glutamate epimerase-like enolase superfamily enzyme